MRETIQLHDNKTHNFHKVTALLCSISECICVSLVISSWLTNICIVIFLFVFYKDIQNCTYRLRDTMDELCVRITLVDA